MVFFTGNFKGKKKDAPYPICSCTQIVFVVLFGAMAVNIQVSKQNNENTMGIIRRFTKRVQGSGVLRRARAVRYYDRPLSKLLRKKKALKSISNREIREELIKLGKIEERPQHHRRGRR